MGFSVSLLFSPQVYTCGRLIITYCYRTSLFQTSLLSVSETKTYNVNETLLVAYYSSAVLDASCSVILRSTMNTEGTQGASTEGQKWLPTKGPLSIHQKALFMFWVSVMLLMVLKKLLLLLKVSPLRSAFPHTASGKPGKVVWLVLCKS